MSLLLAAPSRATTILTFAALLIFGTSLNACSKAKSKLITPVGVTPAQYSVKCESSQGHCENEAESICGSEGYTVLSEHGATKGEDILDRAGAQFAFSTNQGNTDPWRGDMIIQCGVIQPRQALPPPPPREETAVAVGAEAGAVEAAPAPVEPSSTEAVPAGEAGDVAVSSPSCVPEATQACLGPGACQGAQSCAADGRSWSKCDCGN